MALLTTIGLIVLGGVALTTAVTAGCYYATEDERNKAKIEENNSNINAFKNVIGDFSNMKNKLLKAKSCLEAGKRDFANGGHVLDDVPLANPEFNLCLSKIDSAISNVDGFIASLNSEISKLEAENNRLSK